MSGELSLDDVISVSVLSVPQAVSVPNINTAALFSSETPNGTFGSVAYKIYSTSAEVAVDFGSSSKAVAAASAFFGQSPNPLSVGGYLVVIPLLSSGTEAVDAAILRTMGTVYYYGVLVDQGIIVTPLNTLATFCQANKKMLFYCSILPADIQPGGLVDLFRSSSQFRARGLYNTGDQTAALTFAAAYAGRGLSVNFNGANTCITMNLKPLAGVTVDLGIDETVKALLITAGVDAYPSWGGKPGVISNGENSFFDEVYNEDWFALALQAAGFNYFYQTGSKIPQTDKAMVGYINAYRGICEQARGDTGRGNGFISPGAWTSPDTFGDPEDFIRNIAEVGYYIYSIPMSQQSAADRALRKAPTVMIAIKSAGALHNGNVMVAVNL